MNQDKQSMGKNLYTAALKTTASGKSFCFICKCSQTFFLSWIEETDKTFRVNNISSNEKEILTSYEWSQNSYKQEKI